MSKKRVGTDLFRKLAVTSKTDGSVVDLSDALNMKLTVKRQGSSAIEQTFTITDNIIQFQWNSKENTKIGTFNATFEYDKKNSNSETGYIHSAIDYVPVFEIVPTSEDEDWDENVLSGIITEYGVDGKSAYELAVQEGYVGTLDEWIASLKGEKGDKGDKGDKGNTGEQGIQGIQGVNGLSAFDVWNNSNGGNKTLDDYYTYLRQPCTINSESYENGELTINIG